MWTVREHYKVSRVLKRASVQVQINYIAWKRIVELQGPSGVRAVKGYNDEVLKGEWKGFRSSRLGIKWRVIYQMEKKEFRVYVVEVTPHNY